MDNEERISSLIDYVLEKTQQVKDETFVEDKSDLVAAASLEAQLLLASHVAICEAQAKKSKTDLDFVKSQRAIEIKTSSKEKITDAMLEHNINVTEDVKTAKNDVIEAESTFKKWSYINNTLKDAHIFFRNLNKKQI